MGARGRDGVLQVLQKFDDAMFSSDDSVRGEMSRAGSNRWNLGSDEAREPANLKAEADVRHE